MENEENVCRTCLASSSAKFYNLDDPFLGSMMGFGMEQEMKADFAECLSFCTRTRVSGVPQFPNKICEECSHALQIAYLFIKNALKAHEILAHRLGNVDIKEEVDQEQADCEMAVMRFRCKICNVMVETKKALKEHIKLHMDVITYCCQMCDFDCKKRSQLSDHYSIEHNIEATAEQLKPYMQAEYKEAEYKMETDDQIDDIFQSSEQRRREQEEAEKLMQEIEEKLLKEKQMEQQIQNSVQIIADGSVSTDNILVNSMDFGNADFSMISADAISQNFENDISVGSEFMILPDGSVQKVVGSDVVIEYINQDTNTLPVLDSNNLVLENLVQVDANDLSLNKINNADIIEEAPAPAPDPVPADLLNVVPRKVSNINDEESQTQRVPLRLQEKHTVQPQLTIKNFDTISKKIQCKICPDAFQTQSDLKTHMLIHKEIPHFFCDQCAFYTFFRKDLTQHYQTQHNVQPSQRQLQPTNKAEPPPLGQAIYNCDLCFYETPIRLNLRWHYVKDHNVEATEVQLRPIIDNTDSDIKNSSTVCEAKSIKGNDQKNFLCNICNMQFSVSSNYKQHMVWHEKENKIKEVKSQQAEENVQIDSNIATLESNNHIINPNMILPMDAVPQEIASEQTIEHTVSFNFNGDEIFEDFDDNNETIDDGQDDDDLGELFLTSEDDLDDLLEEHGNDDKIHGRTKSSPQLRAYCIHCNKRFFSQYHFENHMFIHRGLAPFRCEMCTNLYNTKRAIIRHYMAVHKTIPTRDMIQAKGDKMSFDKTPIENLILEGAKRCTLMCANCPFESKANDSNCLNELLLHLSSTHGIRDDNYILQKLPFECPRCIRSYESKANLLRHLERSHSMTTVIQQNARKALKKPTSSSECLTSSAIASSRSGTVESSSRSTSYGGEIVKHEVRAGNKDEMTSFENFDPKNDVSNGLISQKKQNQENKSVFECSICHGKYKSEILLKHHFKRHVERNFHCDLCPKSFIVRTELQKHRLLHTVEEKPYKCDLCQKQFGYPHHLKRHKDGTHFGKRYNCTYGSCTKSFTTQAQRNVHRLTHTGNLPYKCRICCRLFSKRDTFRQHSRNVHNINLTEAEIAEIYRENTGKSNPHDLVVALNNGQMLRRSDVEAINSNAWKIPETV